MFLGFIGDDPLALDDVQHLVLVVNMGPGTRARAEVNTEDIKIVAVRGTDNLPGVNRDAICDLR